TAPLSQPPIPRHPIMNATPPSELSRREFVRLSSVSAGAALLSPWAVPRALGATSGSDRLRVGVVGCGGRGSGAAQNCLDAAPGVESAALADLFPQQVEKARAKYGVSPDRCFSGFDAYQRLMATDVDLVILAAPPGFRPSHYEAAVAAG